MARKKQASINTKGLSVKQILDMDLSALNTPDLKRVASRLVSASNKRIRRMQEKGYADYSFPVQNVIKEYGEKGFSTKGKNLNQLHHMVASMRDMLRAETSSVKGFEQVKSDVETRVGKFPDLETEKQFWREYNKYVKDKKDVIRASNIDSTQLQKLLHQQRVVKNRSLRTAKGQLTKYLNSLYEEEQVRKNDMEQDDELNAKESKSKDVFHLSNDF